MVPDWLTEPIMFFWLPFAYFIGVGVGVICGAAWWRIHAIMWRNHVGYLGRNNHR